ncbi:hypothetical protein ACFO1B_35385 [Dactylosporangium siamense]|uniref:Uncharacterized protein n=1 Tax=Dactylosporangium siamense TaxID=685454 RepID=A0A919PLA4_9ACTN|nr:hypothetical protein [Dactylosporangium siamense]GIG45859.1 hypothetical protein Dsi01nite_039000 [Dactylosporangium siamense]
MSALVLSADQRWPADPALAERVVELLGSWVSDPLTRGWLAAGGDAGDLRGLPATGRRETLTALRDRVGPALALPPDAAAALRRAAAAVLAQDDEIDDWIRAGHPVRAIKAIREQLACGIQRATDEYHHRAAPLLRPDED